MLGFLRHPNELVAIAGREEMTGGRGPGPRPPGAVWSLPSGDADYSARLSLLKRHVAQTVRHLLLASQSASRHKISGGSLPCGNGAFGSIRSAMLAIMPGMCIMFIKTRSSMGSSSKSMIGRIRRLLCPARSVSKRLGGYCRGSNSRRLLVNLTNNPRAHSAAYACFASET